MTVARRGVWLLWLGLMCAPAFLSAQNAPRSITVDDLLGQLRQETPTLWIESFLEDRCVERGGTRDVQAALAAAGAESSLLRVVAAIACQEEPEPVDPSILGMGFGDEQFSLIPAGTFEMGSENGNSNERPVHTVTLTRSFYMQRTPVTQGQWREIMGENPSSFSDCGDTCPVGRVSWNDAQAFIQALNQRYPGRNYRLPTEAEWEHAARAGTTGDYGGTGVLDDMGWYSGNSGGRTHPVALKQPNAFNLYDMHGNVWEWVQDWYSATYYSISPGVDPTGPTTGSDRVLRGGSWSINAFYARSALRINNTPSFRVSFYGFRLARTP